jgi:hypothetical protein
MATRARSAKNGRFVKKSHARRNPNTTVVERVKKTKKSS